MVPGTIVNGQAGIPGISRFYRKIIPSCLMSGGLP
jgi:hypothetical protein